MLHVEEHELVALGVRRDVHEVLAVVQDGEVQTLARLHLLNVLHLRLVLQLLHQLLLVQVLLRAHLVLKHIHYAWVHRRRRLSKRQRMPHLGCLRCPKNLESLAALRPVGRRLLGTRMAVGRLLKRFLRPRRQGLYTLESKGLFGRWHLFNSPLDV